MATAPTTRNLQLDGWRAFAVAGVVWQHWTPDSWRGKLPFEIGLYYFLCLTGFLITRILLRDRARGELSGRSWQWPAYKLFQERRALRILVPCFFAMVFAGLVGAPDVIAHPFLYLFQVVNFHMAYLTEHPSGTAHYWTLAIQQQFYLLWPLAILWLPRRFLLPSMLAATIIGPLSRMVALRHPDIINPAMLPPCIMDFFAIGGLLAYALEHGVKAGDRRISWVAWASLLPYATLYYLDRNGHPVPGARHLQQTFSALVFAGVISSTLAGFTGIRAKILLHPVVQNIAKLSYGIYLYHTPMPLLVGHVVPWLWPQEPNTFVFILRLIVMGIFSWGVAWLSWRYVEQPAERLKVKISANAEPPKV